MSERFKIFVVPAADGSVLPPLDGVTVTCTATGVSITIPPDTSIRSLPFTRDAAIDGLKFVLTRLGYNPE